MTSIANVNTDGLQLAAEAFGDGPPLIFAHGLSGNRQQTRRQLAPLSKNYRVILFDQRGHGDSTHVTDPAMYDPVRMAGDIGAVLDHFGIARAIVGGESMGAATALLFALLHPQRVEKLLLTAPAFGPEPNSEVERFRLLGRQLREAGMDAVLAGMNLRLQFDMGVPPEVAARICELFGSHDPQSLATALETVIEWKILPNFDRLRQLAMPVFILAWDNDPLHPLALAKAMAAAIPQAQLQQLPSLIQHFKNPQVAAEAYLKMLQG